MKPNGIISFTTDFGDSDGYVGIMKGVIMSIHPTARLIDISNQIPKHDVRAAAFLLQYSYHYFPVGTVHLAIVDPGVGSSRRPIAVETRDYFFIAPDNGILQFIFQKEEILNVVHIQNKKYMAENISATFHGRDIFSPAAAHLSKGLSINKLGTQISDFETANITSPIIDSEKIIGSIVYIDHFGNLITNIPGDLLYGKSFSLTFSGHKIEKLTESYSRGLQSQPCAIIGSSGYLEIAVNQQSAEQLLNAAIGDRISIFLNENGD